MRFKLALSLACAFSLTAVSCSAQGFVLEYEYPEPQVRLGDDYGHFTTIDHYDLEGDGRAEIVFTDDSDPVDHVLLVIDGHDQSVEWTHTESEWMDFLGFVDFDGDGTREAVVRSSYIGTRIVDVATGQIIDTLPFGYITVIYDFDGDGLPEILIDSDTLGVQIWGQPPIAVDDLVREATALSQNHPNPFNPRTVIRYEVQAAGPVQLDILDLRGGLVRRLVDETVERGEYEATWDGTDDAGRRLASGNYLYRLRVGDFTASRKMLLLK